MSEELAPDNLLEHFRAFELLDDDAAMRGFKRVVRCGVRDWSKLYELAALGFVKPFDVRFAKALVKTLSHLVGSDPDIVFGYAEHGEFSLLLGGVEDQGATTGRGLLSRVASNAAGKLSLLLGDLFLLNRSSVLIGEGNIAQHKIVQDQTAFFQRLRQFGPHHFAQRKSLCAVNFLDGKLRNSVADHTSGYRSDEIVYIVPVPLNMLRDNLRDVD